MCIFKLLVCVSICSERSRVRNKYSTPSVSYIVDASKAS